MGSNEVPDPPRSSLQLTRRPLLDQPQVLLDRAVRVSVHLDAVEIGLHQRDQAREFPVLEDSNIKRTI